MEDMKPLVFSIGRLLSGSSLAINRQGWESSRPAIANAGRSSTRTPGCRKLKNRAGIDAPRLVSSPALVGGYRRLLRIGLWPDRDVVLAVLQLNHKARCQDVLSLVVELDALVTHHQLIGLKIGRLQSRLDLGGIS